MQDDDVECRRCRESRLSIARWYIVYEPELHFGTDVLVQDWSGWRRTRMPHRPETPYTTRAPDWLCEILSPSTSSFDGAKKLAIYAREGVPWAWLIDPLARTLEVLKLEGGRWTIFATHAGAEVVRAEPFEAIELELAALWGDVGNPPIPPGV